MSIRSRWISVAGLCLAAAACSASGGRGALPGQGGSGGVGAGGSGTGGGSSGSGGSGGSSGSSGAPACSLPSGLSATPSAFALPAPRCNTSFSSSAGSSSGLAYGLLDLASGSRPDLVVFHDACDTTVGGSHWDVYPSSASGFAATPSPFSIPAARCNSSFDAAASYTGSVSYQTLGLVSPKQLDLVVTRDTCDSTIGQSHWDVYPWSSSGFAASPVAFGVPAPRCNEPFDATASSYGGTSYATLALESNQPDLVVTRDDCDASVGTTHWDVYRWSASGYQAKPDSFSLPAPRCNAKFDATAHSGDVDYSLFALASKEHPDLVVTNDSCDSSVGETHWDVYPWSASGFAATPHSFSLPAARCGVAFDATAQNSGGLGYAVVDLASSGEPDLVVFRDDCDPSVGQTHWDVYPGSPSGFAAQPIQFSIPAARCNSSFDSSAKVSGELAYFTSDLTAACGPELIVTSDACDATVGHSHWDVYQPLK